MKNLQLYYNVILKFRESSELETENIHFKILEFNS